jgi:RND family efflux transporter MFP subunit
VRIGIGIYAAGLLVLLIRLCAGLAMSLRICGRSRPTGQFKEAIEIRESDELSSPVVLGILRPSIVLPNDWRLWTAAKLNAVLEHERSHVRRSDPILQLLSAAHRAALWFSPFSWLLHGNIVRSAEEASDDSAIAATHDRAVYAEVLLDFMRRGAHHDNLVAVPMARYTRPDVRIRRILEGNLSGREVTRMGVAAILAIGLLVACALAVATPQGRAQAQPVPATKAPAAVPAPQQVSGDLLALGTVTSLSTVRVRSRIEGLLKAVTFKEGELVKEGQLLARVESNQGQSMQGEVMQIEMEITQDKMQISQAEKSGDTRAAAELKAKLTNDQAQATRLAYRREAVNSQSEIRSPITGLAGLRLIDLGNVIHPDEAIVVVAELQPIWVIFNVPEDKLPEIRQRLRAGVKLAVEAWNRDDTAKIAAGYLSAIDNQIDITTGTAKLKAVFQNEDGALFPNQFVNVRLALR